MTVAFFNLQAHGPAEVQYQDQTGNWRMVSRVPNEPPQIVDGMRRASSLYDGARIRAVDEDGRVLDIL